MLVPSQEFFNKVREDQDKLKQYVGQGEVIFLVDKGSKLVIDVDQRIYSHHHEKLLALIMATAVRTPPQGFSFPDMLRRARSSMRNIIRSWYQKFILPKLVGTTTLKVKAVIQKKIEKEGRPVSDPGDKNFVARVDEESLVMTSTDGSLSTKDPVKRNRA